MKIRFYKRADGAFCTGYDTKEEGRGLAVKYLRNDRGYKNAFYPMKSTDELEAALETLREFYGGFVTFDGVYSDN